MRISLFPPTLLLLMVVGAVIYSPVQAVGIEFVSGSWQEVVDQAKSERKLIFVDAYTVWCGPCKAMSRNTFPKEKVGAFFNEHFVSYKFDMEKGEGLEFAETYEVTAYPTLLFINHLGEVVHKSLGYKTPEQLINEGRQALDPKKNQVLVEMEYESGEADPATIYDYAMQLHAQEKDFRKPAEQYFATIVKDKELLEARNWKAIQAFTSDINSREYQYVLSKQKKFMKRYGIQAVADKLYDVLKQTTIQSVITQNPTGYQEAVTLANSYIKDKGQTANRLRMVHAEANREWGVYAQKALYHFETYIIIQPKALDHSARLFAKHIDEPAKLEKAIEWARQSIAIENEAYNNETHALLLNKLGRHHDALKFANKALRIAILNDEQTDSLQQLVDELQRKVRG
ncbi:MAG: thioredoxin fold domain-containing protein [Bacteroidota bacterium]